MGPTKYLQKKTLELQETDRHEGMRADRQIDRHRERQTERRTD